MLQVIRQLSHSYACNTSQAACKREGAMWKDTGQDFLRIPNLIKSLCAPLSCAMVEHLITLEYYPYRGRALSSWPMPADVHRDIIERVVQTRGIVYEWMDIFVRADRESSTRSFPDDAWILHTLRAHTPGNIVNSDRTLEGWQQRGILRREHERGPWELDSVAALLMMRLVNDTHVRSWLPSKIQPDKPRWWCFAKSAPHAPVIPVPYPLQGSDVPHLLWTDWLGAAWSSEWQQYGPFAARWSRPFMNAEEVAVWHAGYAQEIEATAVYAAQISASELRLARDAAGPLMSSGEVQEVIEQSIQRIQRDIIHAMLFKAGQLILEEHVHKRGE
jgi:hypothetical protein